MNINLSFVNNISLLTRAYDHFVHYLMAQRYKKESKDPGSHAKDVKRQHILKSREWLRNTRYEWAVAAKLPVRFRRLLSQTNTHSDNEKTPNGKAKIIKTLVYCSSAANKWFRLLDSKMEESEKVMGIKTQKTPRFLPRVPIASEFVMPPKQLPLDFYNLVYFNKLQPLEKLKIVNTREVVFFPDVKRHLLPRRDSEEKLGACEFTKRYFLECSQRYELEDPTESKDNDVGNGEQHVDDDKAEANGDSIDLECPSAGSDEEDAYFGEFGEEEDEGYEDDMISDDEYHDTSSEESDDGAFDGEDKDGDIYMGKGKGKGKAGAV
ncbi:hypothetical protein CROQUDRAFT_656400 [Cronartium quercuum f. sp. fusiforme G11]|uniref:Uncharacterized protein n=1 Tax=Cronartium quercuum f. sp. fusiforme G11 TaxID=708437 RepID=A0A9P6NP70_9BASI|nr:hypothetical protein CROQUDRAFT_656400 [Cronartium quercuum f. sp. fusiforme G11]